MAAPTAHDYAMIAELTEHRQVARRSSPLMVYKPLAGWELGLSCVMDGRLERWTVLIAWAAVTRAMAYGDGHALGVLAAFLELDQTPPFIVELCDLTVRVMRPADGVVAPQKRWCWLAGPAPATSRPS